MARVDTISARGEASLSEKKKSKADLRITRSEQSEGLKKKEAELGRLAAQQNKEEFFNQITPLLQPLRSYIKRRLRVAYLTLQIRTPVLPVVIFSIESFFAPMRPMGTNPPT